MPVLHLSLKVRLDSQFCYFTCCLTVHVLQNETKLNSGSMFVCSAAYFEVESSLEFVSHQVSESLGSRWFPMATTGNHHPVRSPFFEKPSSGNLDESPVVHVSSLSSLSNADGSPAMHVKLVILELFL